MSGVRIAHLYPRELGINGDSGNVLALCRRLQWRGVPSDVVEVGVGDALPDADIIVIGSGPQGARDAVLPDARRHAGAIREHLGAGGGMLAVGAGLQLLAHELTDRAGRTREGLAVLPVSVADVDERRVGEVLGVEQSATERHPVLRLAGFVNYGVELRRHDGAPPLIELEFGSSRAIGPRDRGLVGEGVRSGWALGTHLHGPVLPMNPSLADDLLFAALDRRGMSLPPADDRVRHADEMAKLSRAAIAARLGRAGIAV